MISHAGPAERSTTVLLPFQQVYDAHADVVLSFLRGLAGAAADDVYQDTWLAALRAYPRLTHAGNLRGWLLTIAHRKALDEFRAGARRATPVPAVPDEAAPEADATDATVWNLVGDLPPKQRDALRYRFADDLDYSRIGVLMGTTAAAARRNVHEGLRKLRTTWPHCQT